MVEVKTMRVKLTIAYDGTNYSGWQIQSNGITVQDVLNQALKNLLGEDVRTIGASRTDAGVHALGNVAVFDTTSQIPAEKFSYALNARLPEDIRIQRSEEVPTDFHPRFTTTIKTYEYQILNRTFADPTRRLYSFHWYGKLDLEAMQQAALYLVGEHDFKSFATESPDVTTTVRTINSIRLWKENDMIHIRVTGNGFLYHMVRIIAGTLLEVGKANYRPEQIQKILTAKDRRAAGPTARAQGLTLVEICYPDWE
ncbi:tRNA pseudouridine(38-40) synthase TruA [Blautia liquoris]|nr:tRNA pseudouridine(38-40) synthase TruA [Blautia liquoris]